MPAAAVWVLVRVFEEMAHGNAHNIIPVHAELTTQEAADMLDSSRPPLIQLLDEGKIDFRKVGTHRRVRFESLLAYKRKADTERRIALAELAVYDANVLYPTELRSFMHLALSGLFRAKWPQRFTRNGS